MRGYSKIKENNPFAQKSRSKKEFQFHDQDLDLHLTTPSSTSKHAQDLDQRPSTIDDDNKKNPEKIDFFFKGKTEDEDGETGENRGDRFGSALKRNFSVSSATSYQKNRGNNGNNTQQHLERQSSARSIQEAVRRAFSVKRSSSVNYSDKYCRIFDQPINGDDDDYYNSDYNHGNDGNYNHEDDYEGRKISGSMEMRSMSLKNKDHNRDHHNHNNGKSHVGSKVVKACKRLFSR